MKPCFAFFLRREGMTWALPQDFFQTPYYKGLVVKVGGVVGEHLSAISAVVMEVGGVFGWEPPLLHFSFSRFFCSRFLELSSQ